jgi:hypothetical protein
MKRKKTLHKQEELFTKDSSRMQWKELQEPVQKRTHRLLAQFLLSLLADLLSSRKESHDATEN